ncbi:MAG: hypothetical protein ABI467_25315, partial [Kofleriaceae bacterium]
ARADQARADQARADQARADQAAAPPRSAASLHVGPGEATAPSPWFDDPAGDTLLGLGVAGVIGGGVWLLSAHAAAVDSTTAPTYDQFEALDAKARSRGMVGVIATGAGAALILGSVIRYATRSTSSESPTVTGWLDPHARGIAITGLW